MNDPFPNRHGKSAIVAMMRDAAIARGDKVMICSIDKEGELHKCVVQSIKRRTKREN